jgi:hypothetical protein
MVGKTNNYVFGDLVPLSARGARNVNFAICPFLHAEYIIGKGGVFVPSCV